MAVLPTNDASGSRHQSRLVVATTILVGSAAMLVLGVEPILLGGLAEAGRLSEAGVGQVAMVEIFGLAIGATAGPFVMNSRMRVKLAVVSLLLALANLAVPLASTSGEILLQRGGAGLLAGLLLGAVSLVLTHNARPERMSGLLMGLSTIPQVLAALLLPTIVIPRLGVGAGFGVLAGMALLSLLVAPLMVDRVPVSHSGTGGTLRWSPALAIVVGAAFLQNAGIGAAWSYLERLAHDQGFSSATVGGAIGGSLAFQVAGALLAAWLGGRLPAVWVLILGSVVQASFVICLLLTGQSAAFIAFACGFGLFWLALQPFLVRQLIALDPTRTAAMLLAPLGLVGFSAGPLVASAYVHGQQVGGAFWAAAAMLVVAASLYAISATLQRVRASTAIETDVSLGAS